MTSTKFLLNLNDVYHALIIIQALICLLYVVFNSNLLNKTI
ncbi:hypothetical protein SLEP1_g27295 [Rubroshorea leprosula]|uniref:Uncharacterized protein n=1 Tax=Rubroshorea leprosula TaxID=152421 RepID=A0AAV5JZ89_9ROSI|nr:hypothetical protein SLEP1_g27295 [Rubroshorea leprosula]